jgi:hypothetical protein
VTALAQGEQRNRAAFPTSSWVTLRPSGVISPEAFSIERKLPMPAAARVLMAPPRWR